MNLQEHYNQMYFDAIQRFKPDNYEVDELIDAKDNRRLSAIKK